MLNFLRGYSQDRFAKKVMRAISAGGGPSDFVYDREAFLLRRPNTVANLVNVYHAFRQSSGGLRAHIFSNFVTSFIQSSQTELSSFAEIESKLVAVVRERAFLVTMEGLGWGLDGASDPGVWPAQDPFSQWFSRAIVIDFPTHALVVNQSHLKDWNVTFDEAFALGLQKLRESSVPKFRQENGYFVGTWNDDYDSSRILLHSLFEDLPLDGDPVVALPNRLTFMVAGSNEHHAVRAMLAKAEAIVREEAKPQNPSPLTVRDGEILDFDVDSSSPIFHEVQRARKFAALATYEDQKANLERHFQQSGKEIFVAGFTLAQDDTGDYLSYSVWSKDVPTLLPETDTVMFFDESQPEPDRIVARAPWNRVVETVGDLMLDTKMFPKRHFVSRFPTAEQLNDLR